MYYGLIGPGKGGAFPFGRCVRHRHVWYPLQQDKYRGKKTLLIVFTRKVETTFKNDPIKTLKNSDDQTPREATFLHERRQKSSFTETHA